MISKVLVARAALAMGLAMVAAGAAHADAVAGRDIADKWCAQCHAVTADPPLASDAAPPFVAIAADPGWTDGALRSWLAAPHDPMPDLSLKQAEIEAIISYIRTL